MTGAAAWGKDMKPMSHRIRATLAVAFAVVAFAGCGSHDPGVPVNNLLPIVELSAAPAEGDVAYYSRRINWFGFDPDGQVAGYEYAVDPVPGGDTTWVQTASAEVNLFFRSPNPDVAATGTSGVQVSLGEHTFVVRARDNLGAYSPRAFVSFTSRTVSPATSIIQPLASASVASTTPSLTIVWRGEDLDGVLTQKPIKYKYKIAAGSDINPATPTSVLPAEIQQYFGRDAVDFFASWDSLPGDSTFKAYAGLTAGTVYYFAVVAFDEAGAYEPRFIVGANVLRFRPSLDRLGPEITVFNEFFQRTQSFGGIDPQNLTRLEIPADAAVTFNWFATSPTVGPVITGYRWSLDNLDLESDAPRENDGDLAHWSPWSGEETSTTLPPFAGSVDTLVTHNLYIEARDNIGFVSLFAIQLRVIKPTFENDLLVVDDLQGTASQPGQGFISDYPMEAEQDSFYYAVGGFPDSIGIKFANEPGAISTPGMFADFAFDTLDYYNFYPNEGILLSDLARYKVVAWFSDRNSGNLNQPKFGSPNPRTAMRFINSVNQLNTLAVYLRQNGKAWLFGEGTTQAIANGFVSRIQGASAQVPWTSGEDHQDDILQLGNFLYDFVHIRSEMSTAGTQNATSTSKQYMHSAIPYLPNFRCPEGSPVPTLGRTCDPRIGPTAERVAVKWGDLPQLNIGGYRGVGSLVNDRRYWPTYIVTQPLFITEGVGPFAFPALDTLYINGAHTYDPNRTRIPPSDGFPNALYYHGTQHGELVWFGFPMHFFEPDQARLTTQIVLKNLGLQYASKDRRGAQPFRPSGVSQRVIADGNTYDSSRKGR